LVAVYESRRLVVPPGQPFLRPVPGDPTSVFGTRRFFNEQPRDPHPGLDLRASTGTPVISSGAGRVALAAELYYAGGTVIVDHGGGLFTVYAHLSELLVEDGDEVDAGSRIGLSGATGRVTGPHLHWGAKIGNRPFDPEALLDPRLFPGFSADQ
jgi:murein DD-endopeptidase MepM/ murein hydrolase activator NlpD